MHEKSINTLEYPKILAKVAYEAGFSAGKELVLALQPTPDLAEARRRLAFTTEASRLIDLLQRWAGHIRCYPCAAKCDACGKKGADVRPKFPSAKMGT